MAVRAFAVSAAPGFEFTIVTVAQQSVVVRIGFDVDVAAVAAITARGAATGDVLLPAKRDAAIATVARFDRDFCFVGKHVSPAKLKNCQKSLARAGSKNKNTRPGNEARIGNCYVSWLPQARKRTLRGRHRRPRILPPGTR